MSRYRFIAAERGYYPVRRLFQVLGVPASGYYAWQAAQQRAVGRPKTQPGKRRWSRFLACTNAAMARAGCRWPCVKKGTGWVANACARPCVAGTCTSCNPRPSPRARPTQRMACGARPTGCSTSPSRPRPTGSGCRTSRICRSPTAPWPICAPLRTWPASTSWAGTLWPPCPKNWSPRPCSGAFWPSPAPALLGHSDRGGQYCGNPYRALLHRHGAVRSQSRRGECYDNAQAESLWSRLKIEVLELREWPIFADLADAQASFADYFDCYNHDRLHSSIGYQAPYHTHQQLLQATALNCPA